MTNTTVTTMNHHSNWTETLQMDAWTELNQAVIRDRIREREVVAAGERLAAVSRSAAVISAAIRTLVEARRPEWTEPLRFDRAAATASGRLAAAEAAERAECDDCPAVVNAA